MDAEVIERARACGCGIEQEEAARRTSVYECYVLQVPSQQIGICEIHTTEERCDHD
jgi:hypothetical protein